jgi:hypothetical protein
VLVWTARDVNRPLSLAEFAFWRLAHHAPANVVVAAQIEGLPSAETLGRALGPVQRRHPLLGVRIDRYGDRPRFVSTGVGALPLRVIRRHGEDHWRTAAEAELVTPLPLDRGPLARVLLLHGEAASDLLITFSHVAGDALSGMYLLRDLLQEVAAPGSVTGRCPERPGYDDLLPTGSLWRDVMRFADGLVGTTQQMQRRAAWSPGERRARMGSAGARPPRVLHWSLAAPLVDRLRVMSRAEGTTVHGALCAALLAAFSRTGVSPPPLLTSAVNMRGRLAVPIGEEFGLYASGASTQIPPSRAHRFWDIAGEVKRSLDAAVDGGAPFLLGGVFGGLLATLPTVAYSGWLEANRRLNVMVTNVGSVDLPCTFGALRLRALRFVPPPGARLVVAATAFQGVLSCELVYGEQYVSPSVAARIGEAMVECLRRAPDLE